MSDVQEKEGPKTRVLSLKLGGDWDYNVTFEQTFQKQKVQTNDAPMDSMTSAIARVVIKAMDYIKIPNINALLDSISFSQADDGDYFTLNLNVKSRENAYVYLKWSISKISREQKLTEDTLDDVPGFEERNWLNDAVDQLEEEIRKYALGERLQRELVIKDPEVKTNPQGDFFQSTKDIIQKGKEFRKQMKDMGAKVTGHPIINVDFTHPEAAEK